MKSNGPLCMYETKQIITRDANKPIPLPNNMYRMKGIHDNGRIVKGSDHVSLSAACNKSQNITEQILENPSEMALLMQRQEKILLQLDQLRQQMISLKTDLSNSNKQVITDVLQKFVSPLEVNKVPEIIINASPDQPPYSLLLIQKLCKNVFHLQVTTHVHSSVTSHNNITKFLQTLQLDAHAKNPIVKVRLIWKNVGPNTELIVTQTPIIGEVNILRYFSRVFPNVLKYETLNNLDIDYVLDICHIFTFSPLKSEQARLLQILNSKLGKSNWFCGAPTISIADIAAYSAVKRTNTTELPHNMSKWFQRCESYVN